MSNKIRTIASYLIYPASWLILLGCWLFMASETKAPQQAWGIMTASLIVFYLFLERLLPYEKKWSMTWKSFLNDMKYLIVNGATISIISTALAFYAISMSGELNGVASNWPFWVQLVAILLIFEAINYIIHRAMHESRGKIGAFLWRVHAAHHLPEKVYVFMHVAGHPINAITTQAITIILPIWLMGYDQQVVTTFLMLNTMHGLISHFNVDVRMGFMNYIFIGPQTHRYHHSANVNEAKNYGATLSIYDQLFGTFVYKPETLPAKLGVDSKEGMPEYGDIKEVLKLPFKL